MLFYLNLTVREGDINSLLFFANVISINTPIFLPNHKNYAYTFISLVNLDLGITTCFYNGMNDYSKIWLQLTFPLYLIVIAVTFIIASRYSIRILTLTANRGLPVLATLFCYAILKFYAKFFLFYSSIQKSLIFLLDTLHWSRGWILAVQYFV